MTAKGVQHLVNLLLGVLRRIINNRRISARVAQGSRGAEIGDKLGSRTSRRGVGRLGRSRPCSQIPLELEETLLVREPIVCILIAEMENKSFWWRQ